MVSKADIFYFAFTLLVACTYGLKSQDGASSALDIFFNGNILRNLNIVDYPYQVSLQYSFYGHICGGVVLNDRWVLTSARCVLRFDSSLFSVLAGTVALDDDVTGVRRSVKKSVIFPRYSESRLPESDIALLELSDPLPLGENIKAISLPDPNFSSILRLECTVTGWGADEYLGDVPFDMRAIELKTINIQLCSNTFSIINITLSQDMTECATESTGNGLGPCTGEWGSPLICKEPLEEKLLLLGLVSGDPLPCSQLAGFGIPFLFSKISFYTEWINSQIGVQESLVELRLLDGTLDDQYST